MFRLSGMLCLVLAVVCGSLLFKTSQSVQRAEQDLKAVKGSLAFEMETLRVLSAEWDYLNRPERLERLTLENLDMDEVQAEKVNFIVEAEAVPEPRVPVIPQVKPSVLFQNVSIAPSAGEISREDSVIKRGESEDFKKLIQEMGAE